MKREMSFAIPVAVALIASGSAFGHALLVKAVPAVGGTVAASPSDIRITFSEAVEPRFSGISLKGGDGRSIATGATAVDPSDHAILVVPLKAKLSPGTYKVNWRMMSVDTHPTQGSFSFEVKP